MNANLTSIFLLTVCLFGIVFRVHSRRVRALTPAPRSNVSVFAWIALFGAWYGLNGSWRSLWNQQLYDLLKAVDRLNDFNTVRAFVIIGLVFSACSMAVSVMTWSKRSKCMEIMGFSSDLIVSTSELIVSVFHSVASVS